MSLRKEVLHRLLLAKSILSPARSAAWEQPNAHAVARQVLNAHDAADLVFAAIADQQNRLPPKSKAPSMMEYLNSIDTTADKHTGYFIQLNEARNGLKHAGNLPNTNQWASVGEDVFEKLSSPCRATLNISLDEVDQSELLAGDEAKAYLSSSKRAKASQDFKLALEELGKALFVSLEETPDLGEIEVGRAKAEDALKLTAFGVSANDFLKLQQFLPRVSRIGSEPFETLWKQSEFGHPGNWREEALDFCISTYLNVALSIQNASPTPHAFPLWALYEYRVTAIQDDVEVWEDLVDEALEHVYADNARPFRTHKRYLKKGESIAVSASTRPFIFDDLSLGGQWIKRVRVSSGGFEGLVGLGPRRGDFVNLADVHIACIPSEWSKERFPDLSEMAWEEDPLAFSL